MLDRLNQKLSVNDLVLIAHPKTSCLLRCVVTKINKQTVTVVACPSKEGEQGYQSQYYMADDFEPGKFNGGNYWKMKKGWYRRPEEVVKVGEMRTDKDNWLMIGDKELWKTA